MMADIVKKETFDLHKIYTTLKNEFKCLLNNSLIIYSRGQDEY